MQRTTQVALLAIAGLSVTAGLTTAHVRNYALEPTFPYLLSCFDDQFVKEDLGIGGAVGAALQAAITAADPLAPDTMGTCYRPNHIVPNANGDVTFSWSDQTQTNVGGCVSQDSDGDNGFCDDIDGVPADVQKRGCNSVTVNINFDDTHNVPLANAYRFQTSQGPTALTTFVPLNAWLRGNTIIPIGELTDCGAATDNWGSTGDINHS